MSHLLTPQQTLLSAMLLHPEICDKVFWETTEEMFSGIDLDIYRKMQEITAAGKKLNVITIYEKEMVQHLTDWCQNLGFYHPQNLDIIAGHINPFVNALRESFRDKKRKEIAVKISTGSDAEEIEVMMDNYLTSAPIGDGGFKHIAEIADDFSSEEKFKELSQSCIETGWPEFDKKIIVKRGDLIVIAARPSMGKTDVALQLAKKLAIRNQPTGFFSLEMKGEYLNKRLTGATVFEEYTKQLEKLVHLPIYIDDDPAQSIRSIRQKIKKAKTDFDPALCIIDYLTLMETDKGETRNREIEELIKGLKKSAREFDLPLVVLAQLSREVERRADKKPMLSDLRDSGAIEQNIDIALFLWRPGAYGFTNKTKNMKYLPENGIENYMEMIIGKQRDGETGFMKFYYDRVKKVIEHWEGRLEYEKFLSAPGNDVPF